MFGSAGGGGGKNSEAIKRNFAVVLYPEGGVRRVIEKPRYVTNKVKGVGVYLFDPHIFDAHTPDSQNRPPGRV